MTTLNLEMNEELKKYILNFIKENNLTKEFFIDKILEMIEDYEDVKLAEERLNDKDNFISGDMKSLAEQYGINYEEL